MDRTYILCNIYTSENSAKHRNTQLSEMYPDVHKGYFFDRVVRIQRPSCGPVIYGISSVWTVY